MMQRRGERKGKINKGGIVNKIESKTES